MPPLSASAAVERELIRAHAGLAFVRALHGPRHDEIVREWLAGWARRHPEFANEPRAD